MAKQTQLPQYKTPERKLEKLLLSLGYGRHAWAAEIALMSDSVQAQFAGMVDDFGQVTKGSRTVYEKWKQEHIRKVREAADKPAPANETGENASE